MILVLDTETTGREPPEVIELAYAEVSLPALQLFEETVYRYKSTFGSSWGALAVHHVLDEELEECPPSMTAKLPAGVDYIIGHNIDYDWKALGSPEVKRICTLAIARSLFPDGDSHTLGAMIYRLEPNKTQARHLLRNTHIALTDVRLCGRILGFMLAQKGLVFDSPAALWEFSEACRIPTIMAFGKHKGMAIKDLPYGYKTWMLKQEDMDSYLLRAVRDSM